MLRYRVDILSDRFVVRDVEKQHDIATCRQEVDAKNISIALNFYNDWVLIDSRSAEELEERAKDKLNHYCE